MINLDKIRQANSSNNHITEQIKKECIDAINALPKYDYEEELPFEIQVSVKVIPTASTINDLTIINDNEYSILDDPKLKLMDSSQRGRAIIDYYLYKKKP